jgi:hypothetical protein
MMQVLAGCPLALTGGEVDLLWSEFGNCGFEPWIEGSDILEIHRNGPVVIHKTLVT